MPTTRAGRVVYNRKPHLFTYKDVIRIVDKIEPPDNVPDALVFVSYARAAIFAILEDLVKVFRTAYPFDSLFPRVRFVIDLMLWILSFLRNSGEFIGDTNKQIISWIRARM